MSSDIDSDEDSHQTAEESEYDDNNSYQTDKSEYDANNSYQTENESNANGSDTESECDDSNSYETDRESDNDRTATESECDDDSSENESEYDVDSSQGDDEVSESVQSSDESGDDDVEYYDVSSASDADTDNYTSSVCSESEEDLGFELVEFSSDISVILPFYEKLQDKLMTSTGNYYKAYLAVCTSMKNLMHNYQLVSKGRTPEVIDFNDITKCIAYLHRYAPCHTALVWDSMAKIFQQCDDSSSFKLINEYMTLLLKKQIMNVVFLGGGPGNDFVGFLGALHGRHEHLFEMEVTVVDMMSGWSRVFNELVAELRLGGCGKAGLIFDDVNVIPSFVEADLTDSQSWEDEMEACLGAADVVFLTKVLSHIPDEDKLSTLQGIVNNLKVGCFLIYIDYCPQGSGMFSRLLRSKLTLLYESSSSKFNFNYSKNLYNCRNITTSSAETKVFVTN